MGGGDLNMKKSWHPLLITNQERVWKQERAALDERKKLQELQKEHAQERIVLELQRLQAEAGGSKREERVDWMYAAPAEGNGVNAEEMELYLLGKKRVDKLLKGNEEKLMSAPTAQQPGGSFTSVQNANSVRDTASKIREDPLLAIKRQEQAQYEKILKNPKRLKELRAAREAATPSARPVKKAKKDETKEERRIRKEGKAAREGHSRDEGRSKRGREEEDRDNDRHRRHHSRSRSPSPRRRSESRRDDNDSRRDSRRDDSRNRSQQSPPSRRPRSRSPSPPPRSHRRSPEEDRRSYRPDPSSERKPTRNEMDSRRSHQSSGPSYSKPPPSHSSSTESKPTESELAERKANLDAKLELMKSSATQLANSRNERLAKLEAEDLVQLKAETESKGRNKGVGPSFLREQEKKVFGGAGMDLGERMRRSGGVGMNKDRD